MIAFQNSISEKRTGPMRPVPSLGNALHGTMRRIRSEGSMPNFATKPAGEFIVPPKNNAPVFSSKKAARLEFAEIIREFEVGEIANDADVSKETVKCWKAARAFPQGQNLILLMFRNKKVCGWVLGKLGLNQMPEFLNDPKVMNALQAFAYRVSFEPDPDGDVARKLVNGEPL